MQQQTPGVYINEINAFPNSVVEVATAVPVFIGYTAKANYNGEDLANKPRRVTSLKEFETYFGQGAVPVFDLQERAGTTADQKAAQALLAVQPLALQIHDVTVYGPGPGATAMKNYSLVPDDGSVIYYLYNSVRLFYQNGGATCYIVSVGQYDGGDGSDASTESMSSDGDQATVKNALGNVADTTANAPAGKPTKDQFIQAIDSLIYEQEPTMLLCPDALCLSEPDYYTVAQKMLQHCNETQSRVAVLDVYKGAVTNPMDLNGDDTPVSRFREGVTNNYLKYGVSYFPWVHTTVVGETETTFQNMSKNMVATVNAAATKALLTAQTDALAKMNSPELSAAQQTLRSAVAYANLVQSARRMHGPSQDDVQREDAARIAAAPTAAGAATTAAATATTDATAAATAATDAAADATKLGAAITAATTAVASADAAAKAVSAIGGNAMAKAAEASAAVLAATAALNTATAAATAAAVATLSDDEKAARAKEATDAATATATAATTAAAAATTAAAAATTDAKAAGAAKAAADAQAAATTALASVGSAQSEADATKKAALVTTAMTDATAAATAATAAADSATTAAKNGSGSATVFALAKAATDAAAKATAALTVDAKADDKAKATAAQTAAQTAKDAADKAANAVAALSGQPLTPAEKQTEVMRLHSALLASNLDYARVIDNITRYRNTLPVAPAMAGVYTAVDTNRGVWKAPANVGLSGVTAPTVNLSDNDQARLNVDAVSGKSVNAIRPFPGQGVLVWGARTLDGNSNDWRFVNVRRTMIMLEQSIKLAARAYVFEPNDANTWVTVQSMISNFLFNLWKQGALAGSKPDDAYSVAVGLGTTMTAQDILDGYMNVFVKVAISRPAEFIVLSFQQQMQKS